MLTRTRPRNAPLVLMASEKRGFLDGWTGLGLPLQDVRKDHQPLLAELRRLVGIEDPEADRAALDDVHPPVKALKPDR
jgi:hypothetical protein